MNNLRHPLAARLLHWIMAALILTMIGIGLAMIDSLATWRVAGLKLHHVGGVSVLILAILRLAFRLTYKAPPLPKEVPSFQASIAHGSHILLHIAGALHHAMVRRDGLLKRMT